RNAPSGSRSCCTHPRRRTRESTLRPTFRRPAHPARGRQDPPPTPSRSRAARCALLGVPLALVALGLLAGLPARAMQGSRVLPAAPAPAPAAAPVQPAAPEPSAVASAPPAGFAGTPPSPQQDATPTTGELDQATLDAIAELEAKIAKDQATIVK